jgi:hypothetical protein
MSDKLEFVVPVNIQTYRTGAKRLNKLESCKVTLLFVHSLRSCSVFISNFSGQYDFALSSEQERSD